MTEGLKKRAERAAKIASAAVQAGEVITLGPSSDISELERHFGLDGAAASSATDAPATILRGDNRAFIQNLEGVATGKVRVVNG